MPDEPGRANHLPRRYMKTRTRQPNYVPTRFLLPPLVMLYATAPFCPHCNDKHTENAIYEPDMHSRPDYEWKCRDCYVNVTISSLDWVTQVALRGCQNCNFCSIFRANFSPSLTEIGLNYYQRLTNKAIGEIGDRNFIVLRKLHFRIV